jgi:hypothetical protein
LQSRRFLSNLGSFQIKEVQKEPGFLLLAIKEVRKEPGFLSNQEGSFQIKEVPFKSRRFLSKQRRFERNLGSFQTWVPFTLD